MFNVNLHGCIIFVLQRSLSSFEKCCLDNVQSIRRSHMATYSYFLLGVEVYQTKYRSSRRVLYMNLNMYIYIYIYYIVYNICGYMWSNYSDLTRPHPTR